MSTVFYNKGHSCPSLFGWWRGLQGSVEIIVPYFEVALFLNANNKLFYNKCKPKKQ